MRRMRVRAAIAENVHSRQHAINLGKKRFPLYTPGGGIGARRPESTGRATNVGP